MRTLLAILTALTLQACAPASPDSAPTDTAPVAQRPVSAIPDAFCAYVGERARWTCGGTEESVATYDCGMRDGRHCWLYTWGSASEIVCQMPDSFDSECM